MTASTGATSRERRTQRRALDRATAQATGATRSTVSVASLMAGPGRKTKGTKMTATQRNSQGKPSEWNRSCDFFTDPKWGKTVREVRA